MPRRNNRNRNRPPLQQLTDRQLAAYAETAEDDMRNRAYGEMRRRKRNKVRASAQRILA